MERERERERGREGERERKGERESSNEGVHHSSLFLLPLINRSRSSQN